MGVMYGAGEVFSNPMIRFQFFSEPVSLGYDLHKHFSSFSPSSLLSSIKLDRKAGGSQSWVFLFPHWEAFPRSVRL